MRLGKHQLRLLRVLAGGCFQIVPDKVSRSLIAKGLAVAWSGDAFVGVTPAGLRALADAADSGQLDLSYTRKPAALSPETER